MDLNQKLALIFEGLDQQLQEAIDLIEAKSKKNPEEYEHIVEYGSRYLKECQEAVKSRGIDDIIRVIGRNEDEKVRPGLGFGRYFGEFCEDGEIIKAVYAIEDYYVSMDRQLTEEEKQEVLKMYLERKAKGEYEQKK